MFAWHLRCLYRTCDKIIVRTVRGRNHVPSGPNPGLDNRLRAFKKDGLPITHDDAEEFLERSDSDFYKVGEAYNEHLNESLIGKYELQHQIVKEKYFKENMPNLLTWSEKEQIRHLHEEEPEEWTPEKLAESFPVTVPVVKKLLKYKWKPATEQRITRHDANVMRNWRELKEGSIDIPKSLRDHFLKFSNRTIPPLSKDSIKIDLTQEEKLGEFEKIVKRCAAQSPNRSDETEDTQQANYEGHEKIVKENVRKDSKLVTLDELMVKIKKRLEHGNRVDVPDKIMLSTINLQPETVIDKINMESELSNEESKESGLVEYNNVDSSGKDIMRYPERIRIPKKAYKKDATYKVNDCYYDHDGRFLYRVLGMSNNNN